MHALFICDIGQDALCKFVVSRIHMGHIAVDRFKFPGNVEPDNPDEFLFCQFAGR